MVAYDNLLFEINQKAIIFCQLLDYDSVDIRLLLLDILKRDLDKYSPTNEMIDSFLYQFPGLVISAELHEPVVYVLTQLTNHHHTFAALGRLQPDSNPFSRLLSAAPPIVIQVLKILFLLLTNQQTRDSVSLNEIHPLLTSTVPSIARLAAMCLALSPDDSILNDNLVAFLHAAFQNENELTLDALRLSGAISRTAKGRSTLREFLPAVCGFTSSTNAKIQSTAFMLLTAISAFDQLSEPLVGAVITALNFFDNAELREAALTFVTNMSINFEAAVVAAPHLKKLVDRLFGGEIRAIAAIYRVVVIGEGFKDLIPVFAQFVKETQQALESDLLSVIVEIYDAAARLPEGQVILRDSGFVDSWRSKLDAMEISDPVRPILIRLLTRIR
jgi:hypothetical protein